MSSYYPMLQNRKEWETGKQRRQDRKNREWETGK
jgi:hypothetical protein